MDAARAVSPERRGAVPVLVWVLLGSTAALVVAAVVLVAAGGRTARFASDTPEGVVQRFVKATLDGDVTRARSFAAAEPGPAEADCTVADVGSGADARVVLVRTRRDDDRAVVTVKISGVRGFGSLGPVYETARDDFVLRQVDGEWTITAAPWPFATCNPKGFGP